MKKSLLLILLGFVVYSGSLSGGFLWDDQHLITGNEWLRTGTVAEAFLMRSLPGFNNYYRPIQLLSYKLDYLVWGLQPFGYHLSNLILHLCNAVLVFLLFSRLDPRRLNERVAFVSAVLFCIHPLLSEPVNYISSRSDLLMTFFLLTAFFFLLKGDDDNRPRTWLAAFFFLLALLSKEAALVFPLVALVYLWLFRRGESARALPLLLITAGYLVSRSCFGFQAAGFPHHWRYLLMTDASVYALMLRLLLIPVGLHKDWFIPILTTAVDPVFLLSLLALFSAVLLTLRFSWGYRRVLFGICWFILFLLPASSLLIFWLLGVSSFVSQTVVSESWGYLASAGCFLCVAEVSRKLSRRVPAEIVYGGFCVLVILLSVLTVQRSRVWSQDPIIFYRQTLTFQPRNSVLHYNMGNEFLNRGRYAEAEQAYLRALSYNPDYFYARNNLCNLYVRQGRFTEAITECERAVSQAPWLTKSYQNLEDAYRGLRKQGGNSNEEN